ncbi:MAG: type II toxin-antitoxin system RelE/ParE family toxin [Cyclobacteriaceae bacterium]|nr:type II toxin-antitoxin system RelE/ParE family toxin [Cyclobacteriaceae bacterium]MBX2916397.1 type II toxin-antitoxin system RelE/ParE family toxin [Cyclobacteriaceae bacterium]
MARTVVWNKQPVSFLIRALKWISADSVLQAERIEQEIIRAVNSIPDNPEKYPPDRFRRANTGNFRAFEVVF